MGKKIAMVGAGSVVFCKMLMSDIMATPSLAGSEFALMSRTWPKLKDMEEFLRLAPNHPKVPLVQESIADLKRKLNK